jgi:hypothetical protein
MAIDTLTKEIKEPTISQMIDVLQKALDQHGDVPCCISMKGPNKAVVIYPISRCQMSHINFKKTLWIKHEG